MSMKLDKRTTQEPLQHERDLPPLQGSRCAFEDKMPRFQEIELPNASNGSMLFSMPNGQSL